MFNIDSFSKLPVWEQIVEEIKKYILLGILKPGDKIPSVREFSVQAGVNPNTVTKAYNELSRLELISAAGGIGSFVHNEALNNIKKMAKNKIPDFEKQVEELLASGVSREELVSIVDGLYEKINSKVSDNEKN